MADIADKAQELEERHRNEALSHRIIYDGGDVDNCVVCGNNIPSARQVALPGVETCVVCALS